MKPERKNPACTASLQRQVDHRATWLPRPLVRSTTIQEKLFPSSSTSQGGSDQASNSSFQLFRVAFEALKTRKTFANYNLDVHQEPATAHRFRTLKAEKGLYRVRSWWEDILFSEWRHVAFAGADYLSQEIAISDIPKFFDSQVWASHAIMLNYQPHDYCTNGRSTRVLNFLKIQWLDSPGLWPGDIHARHILIQLDDKVTEAQHSRILWRSVYECNGCLRTSSSPLIEQTIRYAFGRASRVC